MDCNHCSLFRITQIRTLGYDRNLLGIGSDHIRVIPISCSELIGICSEEFRVILKIGSDFTDAAFWADMRVSGRKLWGRVKTSIIHDLDNVFLLFIISCNDFHFRFGFPMWTNQTMKFLLLLHCRTTIRVRITTFRRTSFVWLLSFRLCCCCPFTSFWAFRRCFWLLFVFFSVLFTIANGVVSCMSKLKAISAGFDFQETATLLLRVTGQHGLGLIFLWFFFFWMDLLDRYKVNFK